MQGDTVIGELIRAVLTANTTGMSLNAIAVAVGKNPGSVHRYLMSEKNTEIIRGEDKKWRLGDNTKVAIALKQAKEIKATKVTLAARPQWPMGDDNDPNNSMINETWDHISEERDITAAMQFCTSLDYMAKVYSARAKYIQQWIADWTKELTGQSWGPNQKV